MFVRVSASWRLNVDRQVARRLELHERERARACDSMTAVI